MANELLRNSENKLIPQIKKRGASFTPVGDTDVWSPWEGDATGAGYIAAENGKIASLGSTADAAATDISSSGTLISWARGCFVKLRDILARLNATLSVSGTVKLSGSTFVAGQRSLSATAVPLVNTSSPCNEVLIQNPKTNTTDALIGDSNLQPIVISPGEAVTIPASDASAIYVRAALGTPTLSYIITS